MEGHSPESPRGHHPSLIDTYLKRGRIDFTEAPKEQVRQTFVDYQQRFAAVPHEAQTEMLEQFLLLGVCTEAEAQGIVQRMSAEQKATIGAYIGKTLKPGFYIHLFHDLWEDLDYSTRDFW